MVSGCIVVLFVRALFHGTYTSIGNTVAFLDTSHPLGRGTIRHKQCQIVLSNDSRTIRCSACSTYRLKLLVQRSRTKPQPSEHTNYRYLFHFTVMDLEIYMHKFF